MKINLACAGKKAQLRLSHKYGLKNFDQFYVFKYPYLAKALLGGRTFDLGVKAVWTIELWLIIAGSGSKTRGWRWARMSKEPE